MWQIICFVWLTLCQLQCLLAENNVTATTLKHIYTLGDRCEKHICRNFNYANINEVAFFDLKMEVHITNDSTYEVGPTVIKQTLGFENSAFAHFPLHLFYAMDILNLDMSNCSISVVTWENFLMANNLHVLYLSDNQIESITELTFEYAPELKYLYLDGNRLRKLVNESFRGLNKLLSLDLSDNLLRDLPAEIFKFLPVLEDLRLNHNRLFSISDDHFVNNPQLNILTLNDNRLHDIGEYAFKSQPIMYLDISNNRPLTTLVINIQSWELNAKNCSLDRVNIYGAVNKVDLSDNFIFELYFAQPEGLEILNLHNNKLPQISSLTRFTSLKSLDLSDNPDIDMLPKSWNNPALKSLDLSNTNLKGFSYAALADHANLRVLNISNNKLREINLYDFQYLENLTHFYIHANDWNCYNLQRLMDMLIRPNRMSFRHDTFDPDFPGEYLYGIACMYRIQSDSAENEDVDSTKSESEERAELRAFEQGNSNSNIEETNQLREELKAIVGFYEQKFKRLFDMFNNLDERLTKFEKMNSTLWERVTITV